MTKQAKKTQMKVSIQPVQEIPILREITEAEKIWNEIKNNEVSMFGLSNQTVSTYCSFHPLSPDTCYLKYKVSAAIPAVEAAVAKHFTIESTDKYIILTRKAGK